MALKATIYKAQLQLADMDRHVYTDRSLTLARHPSETDERMMVRLLAYALALPADDDQGALEFAKDLWETDEPALWRKDLTGAVRHWIEVGQPDERRLLKAAGRADKVSVYSYAASTPIWWNGLRSRITRVANVEVWRLDPAQSQALAGLAQRGMQLQVNVQDGVAWIGEGERGVEVVPERLHPAA